MMKRKLLHITSWSCYCRSSYAGGSKVAKISIVPRGMSALGYTLQLPTEERFLNSKEELKGQIATLLGGRSAER